MGLPIGTTRVALIAYLGRMTTARHWAARLLVAYLLIRGVIVLIANISDDDWPGVAFSVVWIAFLVWIVVGFGPDGAFSGINPRRRPSRPR